MHKGSLLYDYRKRVYYSTDKGTLFYGYRIKNYYFSHRVDRSTVLEKGFIIIIRVREYYSTFAEKEFIILRIKVYITLRLLEKGSLFYA
jgi:hypothetical protein